MPEETSAGGVVINENGHVVVVSQGGVTWSLPKGHVDPGENLVETARREIYEESGISDLEYLASLGSYRRDTRGLHWLEKKMKTIHFFLFKTRQTTLKPLDPDNPEARWLRVDQVSALLSHPRDKEFFEEIRGSLEEVCGSIQK